MCQADNFWLTSVGSGNGDVYNMNHWKNGHDELGEMMMIYYSYGHLLLITGYKWDYTFYKLGFLGTYNW